MAVWLHKVWAAVAWLFFPRVVGLMRRMPLLAKANDALLIEINPEETNISCETDVVICDLAEEVFPVLIEEIRKRCN